MIENRMVLDRARPEMPTLRAEFTARRELVQQILGGDERFFNIDAAGFFDYEQSIPVMIALGKFLRDGNKEALLRVIEEAAWDIATREIK